MIQMQSILEVADNSGAVKVPHSTTFDPVQVKQALGLGLSAWDRFSADLRRLSDRKLHRFEAMNFLVDVLGDPDLPLVEQPNQKALQQVFTLYSGEGKGSELSSASWTAWGLLNGVTEYVDRYRRARSTDYRLDSAWFGQGAAIKQRAYNAALALAA